MYIVIASKKIFIKQNYEYYRNFCWSTLYKKYFGLHDTVSSVAVTTLRLVVGVGVKRRADRRGSTVHGTASVLCEFQETLLCTKPTFWRF